MARPEIQTVSMSAMSKTLVELVREVAHLGTRVVVVEDGELLAALVSPEDLARLNRLDTEREDAGLVFDEIRARNVGVDPDEVERDVAAALAEVRAQMRAERERDQAR
jgi:hypothetical protein